MQLLQKFMEEEVGYETIGKNAHKSEVYKRVTLVDGDGNMEDWR